MHDDDVYYQIIGLYWSTGHWSGIEKVQKRGLRVPKHTIPDANDTLGYIREL